MTYTQVLKGIANPQRVFSRPEIISKQSPVPKSPGVYAWYFKTIPEIVPTKSCITYGNLTLLYVGIAPKKPPRNGRAPSKEHLRSRIRYHMLGNAEGSTLRLSLGCILSNELGIQLRRVGSGKRMTFADGECHLSTWLEDNAFIAWVDCETPWIYEEQLIRDVSAPLNLQHNKHHEFHPILTRIRQQAKISAGELPI